MDPIPVQVFLSGSAPGRSVRHHEGGLRGSVAERCAAGQERELAIVTGGVD
jgi:hypothetical protein